jgi:nucleotide-binding universal stress UspA family protein
MNKKMKKIDKIVVPIDFTKNTRKQANYALYIAESLHADIDFFHVVPDYPADAMIGSPNAQQYQEKNFAVSKKRMAELIMDSREICPGCDGEVAFGDPVDQIVEFADSRGADLIIVSTHDAKGLEKMLLGSLAEHVMNKAHCHVMVMKPFNNG